MDDITAPKMQQMVRWREQYVSASLNKKFFGVLNQGVYKGFKIATCAIPQTVKVTHGSDAYSVALIDRNGYSITVIMTDEGYIQLPAVGTWFLVLEAFYAPNTTGYERIVTKESITSTDIVIAKVVVTTSGALISSSAITEEERTISKVPTLAQIKAVYNELGTVSTHKKVKYTITGSEQTGDIITIPGGIKYIPNYGAVSLYYSGVRCHLGEQFEEIVENGSIYSSKIRLLFTPSVEDDLYIYVSGVADPDTISEQGAIAGPLTMRVTALESNLQTLSGVVPYIHNNEAQG